MATTKDKIKANLPTEPTSAKDIAKQIGVSVDTTRRALNELVEEGILAGNTIKRSRHYVIPSYYGLAVDKAPEPVGPNGTPAPEGWEVAEPGPEQLEEPEPPKEPEIDMKKYVQRGCFVYGGGVNKEAILAEARKQFDLVVEHETFAAYYTDISPKKK